MEHREASVISRPKLSVGLASRCSCRRAWYLCLCRTSRQLCRGPTGRISKSSSGSGGGGGGGAPPTITPPGGKEGLSEDVPVDGDFDISLYGSKAGWKIQLSSSSKNASSYDLLVPRGTGFHPTSSSKNALSYDLLVSTGTGFRPRETIAKGIEIGSGVKHVDVAVK